MTATTSTRTMDSLLTTTSDNLYKGQVIMDAFFESTAITKMLMQPNFKSKTKGGDRIRSAVRYGGNSTVKSQGEWEQYDTTPQDNLTTAFWDWKMVSGTAVMSTKEGFQNSGAAEIQDLWTDKIETTTMQFGEDINAQSMDLLNTAAATGNGGLNITSIPNLVSKDPTTGVVGAIDRAAVSQWRNRTKQSSATSHKQLVKEMWNIYHTASRGSGGSPDKIFCDQQTFELYVSGLDEKVRYQSTDKASAGFPAVGFAGATLFWDVDVPDPENDLNGGADVSLAKGAMYMLNSKYFEFVVGEGFDFAPQGLEKGANQFVKIMPYLFMGELFSTNLRKQAVFYNIARSLT